FIRSLLLFDAETIPRTLIRQPMYRPPPRKAARVDPMSQRFSSPPPLAGGGREGARAANTARRETSSLPLRCARSAARGAGGPDERLRLERPLLGPLTRSPRRAGLGGDGTRASGGAGAA